MRMWVEGRDMYGSLGVYPREPVHRRVARGFRAGPVQGWRR